MILHSLIVASMLAAAPPRAALRAPDASPPGIRLWTSHGEVYQRGERVRVFFRTESDAYVTILRVDADGRVRVLFPRQPWEDNRVRGGYSYDVPNYGRRDAFIVDDDPGVGYVFGVASADPFAYDAFVSADHWDLQLVSEGGRIHGDPYQTLEELIQRIVPAGYADYDTHLMPYYVERRFDYPRFVCYDCHSYVNYGFWNPYAFSCPRFTLWITNDPFYYTPSYWYPSRYYGGARTVYLAPAERGGRYVFKAREDQSAPAIGYRDRSRESIADRRPAERGVRGTDIGGVGSVPAPGGRRAVEGAGTPVGGGPTRLVPATRIPLVRGNAQTPGRHEAQPPVVRTDVTPASGPRGVVIDPYAGSTKATPQPRTPGGEAQATPNAEPGRRAEPVYLGRPATPRPQPEPKPSGGTVARQPERRPEPRATPAPERRAEPRSAPRASSPSRPSSPPPSRPSAPAAAAPRRRPG
jgi:hypothetical protein